MQKSKELIQWIATLEDDTIVQRIKMLKENQTDFDWRIEVSDEERRAITQGLEDIDAGRIVPHHEARKLYEKWL